MKIMFGKKTLEEAEKHGDVTVHDVTPAAKTPYISLDSRILLAHELVLKHGLKAYVGAIKGIIESEVRAERIANQKHWINQLQKEVDRMEAINE